MNRTVESPFVDAELFAHSPEGPNGHAVAAESPFLDFLPDAAAERLSDDAELAFDEASSAYETGAYEAETGAYEIDTYELDAHEDAESVELAGADEGEAIAFEDFAAAPVELEDDFDPASNEYEPIDPASNEYESGVEESWVAGAMDLDPSSAEFDGELFQRLVPLGTVVERAMVSAQIASGKRDVNELTNFLFFIRHPVLKGTRLGKGQETLMAEWRQIRDTVVLPALAAAGGAAPVAAAAVDLSAVRLGTLVCNAPGNPPFSYQFTPDDLLWTARFINGEAGGRDDAENRAIIWTMFNRYAFFRHKVPGWGSFGDFIRQYSTPLQPYLKKYEQVKKWVAACNATFDNAGCNYQPTRPETYPGTNVRKGQLKTFLALQRTPWQQLKPSSRALAARALSGGLPNPIGNASEFADTAVYYQRAHNGQRPTRAQWEQYTREFAKRKDWEWRPDRTPYDEYGRNVLFVHGGARNFPPGVTSVSPAAGATAPAAPAPASAPAAVPSGNPDLELLFDGTRPAQGTVETRRSYPTSPPITGNPSNRTRMRYDNAINQFAVGVNPRYAHRVKNGRVSTYCNIFLWDVTRAMGCEIPHWINKAGEPVGHKAGGNELNANAVYDWLHRHGARYGWARIADAATAQAQANRGRPVIAAWKKAGGIGHVAVVRPGEVTSQGPAVAQAGAKNFNHGRWASLGRRGTPVELWGHA